MNARWHQVSRRNVLKILVGAAVIQPLCLQAAKVERSRRQIRISRFMRKPAWSWGTNIAFIEKKLNAVCQAHG